jgi:hypothetical protein
LSRSRRRRLKLVRFPRFDSCAPGHLKLVRFPARSPLPIAALPSMSLFPKPPFDLSVCPSMSLASPRLRSRSLPLGSTARHSSQVVIPTLGRVARPSRSIVSRSLPLGSTATRRGVTGHVADPVSSILIDCGRDNLPGSSLRPMCQIRRTRLLTRCLPIVSWAQVYIPLALRLAQSCICPSGSCRKDASLAGGKCLSPY